MTAVTGTNTGGSAITSYNLEINGGGASSVYTSLLGISPLSVATTYTKTGLTTNTVYKFRYRVRNIYGWGPYSNTVDIRTAALPAQIGIPIATLKDESIVKITWSEPDNGGSPITSYKI